jgi:hypothetical protein
VFVSFYFFIYFFIYFILFYFIFISFYFILFYLFILFYFLLFGFFSSFFLEDPYGGDFTFGCGEDTDAECVRIMTRMLCGVKCSPQQYLFWDAKTNKPRICQSYADKIFNYCSGFSQVGVLVENNPLLIQCEPIQDVYNSSSAFVESFFGFTYWPDGPDCLKSNSNFLLPSGLVYFISITISLLFVSLN